MDGCHTSSSEKLCKSDNTNSQKGSSRRQKPFASWVILDIEVTGWKRRPRIAELCMLALLTDELKSRRRPRIVNKLQLCFNPQSAMEAEASRITGLYNDVLEQMSSFKEQASLITGFVTSLSQPVCIIAHNGLHFDFPLLQSELRRAGCALPAEAEIYCADSLEAFRVLDGLPAIPEWIIQREREERQRKASASGTTYSDSRDLTSNEVSLKQNSWSSAVTVCLSVQETAQDKKKPEGELDTISPNKRQVSCIDSSHDNSQSACKLSKTDTASSFAFQSSLTDDELTEAYAAITQANAGHEDGHVSPDHVVAPRSLQSVQETTPARDLSQTDPGPGLADHVVKKQPPLLVSNAEREKVARRLFDEESDGVNDDSFSKNRSELGLSENIKSSRAHSFALQRTLSDEELVQEMLQFEAVVSPSPSQLGAGDPLSSFQTKGDAANGTMINTSMKLQIIPTGPEIGVDPFPTSSAQNHASDSSPSAIAAIPNSQPDPCKPPTMPKVSYKLCKIYKRQFGQYPNVSHTAEDDCLSLLKIITLNKMSDFMQFVEDNAVKFDSVEPMYY